MAQQPPAGWKPLGNGGYQNPASGTVIYPDGHGGWSGVPSSPGGSAQPDLPPDYGMPGHPGGPAPRGIKDAGSGRPSNALVAQKSHIFSMSPRARQAYLRSMGYRVNIDGKSGPQTASAAWSFVHGHGPGWYNNQSADWQQSIWNQHFAQYHKPAPGDVNGTAPQTGTGKQKDPNNRQTQDAGNQQFSGNMPNSGLGADLGLGVAELYKLAGEGQMVDPRTAATMGTMLDPKAAGAAAAEAQYGQALRDAQRQVAYLPRQAAQDQADLQSWYGILGNKMAGYTKAEAAMADSLINSAKGDTAGLVNAMGGDANLSAGDITASGNNNVADLQALKLVGAQGDSELAQAIAGEGVSMRTRQRILDQNALTDAQNKLSDTQKAYGATQTQALQDAIDKNNALAQARLQARMGIIGANNGVLDARAQRLAGAISAEEGAASLGPSLDYKTAMAAKAAAAASGRSGKLGTNQPKGAWVNLNGTQRQHLSQTAIQSVQAGIQAKDSVPNIVSKVVNYYRSQGLHPANNPEVAQAIVGALQAGGIQPDKSWAIVKWAHLG